MELILTKNIEIENYKNINAYLKYGGYSAVKKALGEYSSEKIVDEVKKSNLRGRGGAGFPTGMKWSFVPKNNEEKFLCVNADEGEPGSFKDRLIMEKNPHLLIEGIIISCYAIGINTAYVYIRGEYLESRDVFLKAVEEAKAKKLLGKNILGRNFSLDIIIVAGAGAYVCGEETGLIESIEGKKGWPRIKPPFPAIKGLFQKPTVVNNVETIANIPWIILNSGEKFANFGTSKNGGTKLYTVSGHVKNPGVFELPIGTSLREIIYTHCNGIRDDKKLKAVIPGGLSAPVLKADEIDVAMDFDSLAKIGSMLGSGGIIVMDEDTNIVEIMKTTAEFYAHESCGQCTPCREGTEWMRKIIDRIYNKSGKKDDLNLLLEITDNIIGRTICPLGDAASMPIKAFITKFRDEIEKETGVRS